MANIGLPGTSSFIGEFLILVGSYKVNTSISFFGATGMILGGCYSLWLFNRIAYGNLKVQYCKNFLDLNKKELLIFVPLVVGTTVTGLLPNVILTYMHMSVNKLIEFVYF
jgi:NADH:ubiquinone oxidoreductase subunit 4 (subunit M)